MRVWNEVGRGVPSSFARKVRGGKGAASEVQASAKEQQVDPRPAGRSHLIWPTTTTEPPPQQQLLLCLRQTQFLLRCADTVRVHGGPTNDDPRAEGH